jgi:hypothetical protein
MHVHFGPDTIGGRLDSFDMHSVSAVGAAREAVETGLGAVVLKSHSFASPMIARNIEEAVPGICLFGGICTDYISGGLNLEGVEAALSLGAKIVWLPTVHSRQDFGKHKLPRQPYHSEGIAVVDRGGKIVPEVMEIFAMVREQDAILATGHTTADEHYAVVKALARQGKVLVTHAGEKLAGPRLTPEQSRELAELGAFVEVTAQMCKEVMGHPGITPGDVMEMIRTIGPARVCLSTDYGWSTQVPRPAAGMYEFLEALWMEGVTDNELRTMVSDNPARLLNLSF